MDIEVFDERICILGESPFAFGEKNSEVSWVDIVGSRVLIRDLITGESQDFSTNENVGFALRRENGGYILGTNSGPILKNLDGTLQPLFSLSDVDPQAKIQSVRWNEASISPSGSLFLGTMAYSELEGTSTLFRYSPKSHELVVLLKDLTISNGMDWNDDGTIFYFIDSNWQAVRSFSVSEDGISMGENVIEIAPEDGAPDGMCMDSEGGIWVVLWGGSEIRRYDSNNNYQLSERIKLPAKFVTSCAFAGENLDTLIITSATDGRTGLTAESGMTFCLVPGVKGRLSRPFPG